MKKLVLVAMLLSAFSAFADHHEGDGKNFEENKAKMLSHMDSRISELQKSRSCVASAANKEALKSCRHEMKENRKEMKKDWKAKKEEWKANKKKK